MFSEFNDDLRVLSAKARAYDRLLEWLRKTKDEYAGGEMMSMAESSWGEVVTKEAIDKADSLLEEEWRKNNE